MKLAVEITISALMISAAIAIVVGGILATASFVIQPGARIDSIGCYINRPTPSPEIIVLDSGTGDTGTQYIGESP